MPIRLLLAVFILACFHSLNSQSLVDSLKAHYQFENSLADSSGNNHHLNIVTGSTGYALHYPNDNALHLNGNTCVSTLSGFNNSYYTKTAISLWIKTGTINNRRQVIIQGAYMGFAIMIEGSTGKIQGFFDSSSSGALTSASNYADNKWHHIVVQSDGQSTEMYIDGIFEGSINETMYTGNGASNNKLYIGKTNLDLDPYTGLINDLRIYNRTLRQSDIDSLGSLPCNYGFRSNLKAYFKFDGALTDLSSNNEHLTSTSRVNYNAVSGTDSAINFNTTTQLISQNTFNNSNYSATSISLWVSTSTNTNASNQTILQGAFIGFGVFLTTNGHVSSFFDGSSANSLTSDSSLTDNLWHHVVAQNDGSTTYLYIDGKYKKSHLEPLFVGNGNTNNRLYFGLTNLNLAPFAGLLNNVRIYNRVLSDCEIDSLYRLEKPSIATGVFNLNKKPNSQLAFYPNPSTGKVYIDITDDMLRSKLVIRNTLGQVVYNEVLNQTGTLLISLDDRNSIYIAELTDNKGYSKSTLLVTR